MTKQEFEKLTEVAEKQAIEITQLRKDIDEIAQLVEKHGAKQTEN